MYFQERLSNKSLYTRIPNIEGIKPIKEEYEKHPFITVSKIKIKFLTLIFTLNSFVFNSKFYLQVTGCAMNTIRSSTYANIFMIKV